AGQLASLWQLLDKIWPYEIEETEVALETQDEPRAPYVTPRRRAYIVQQLCWQYNDNWYDIGDDEPIKAFTDPELADIYRFDLEETFRKERRNPLRLAAGPLANATSLSEEELLTRLAELGVEPPPLANDGGPLVRDFWNDEWWRHLWNRGGP